VLLLSGQRRRRTGRRGRRQRRGIRRLASAAAKQTRRRRIGPAVPVLTENIVTGTVAVVVFRLVAAFSAAHPHRVDDEKGPDHLLGTDSTVVVSFIIVLLIVGPRGSAGGCNIVLGQQRE
jgi:hypothetical protein